MPKKKTEVVEDIKETTTEAKTGTKKTTAKKAAEKKEVSNKETKGKVKKEKKKEEPSVYTLSSTLLQTVVWSKAGDRADFLDYLFFLFDDVFEEFEGMKELKESFSAFQKSQEKMALFHEFLSDSYKKLPTVEEKEALLAGLNYINLALLKRYNLV